MEWSYSMKALGFICLAGFTMVMLYLPLRYARRARASHVQERALAFGLVAISGIGGIQVAQDVIEPGRSKTAIMMVCMLFMFAGAMVTGFATLRRLDRERQD